MIVSLRGLLREKKPASVWIDAGGVGYGVHVSLSTFETLPAKGSEVELLTVLVVREDSHQLYGFATGSERKLFELLLTVSGVGPRVALAILSGLRPEALARSLRNQEVGALTAVSGVGRKTAERILVELRDKLPPELSSGPSLPPAYEDAVAALVSLGFTQPQAREAVQSAAKGANGGAELEAIVREALASAGRK